MTEETHELAKSMDDCSIKERSIGEHIGRVNWFNKTKGFGFVKIISECEWKDKEIFLHFTNIISDNYKVVFPGEYISLDVDLKPDDPSKYISVNVTGVMGGKLLVDNEEYNYKVYQKNNMNNMNNMNND